MGKKHIILEQMNSIITCIECVLRKESREMLHTIKENQIETTIIEVEEFYKNSSFPQKHGNAIAEITSVKVSFYRILRYLEENHKNAWKKVEFEFLPLMEHLRMNFYYHTWIGKDKEKREKYLKEEISIYSRNRYLEKAKKTGKYKYDISIIVLAYNKLDYTKMCVQSLKRFLPENLRYELIFVNHGSSDGTKEYFESENPDKQIDIEINGGGLNSYFRIVEGKYIMNLSNDVLVTKNVIENMYRCIESDEKIGWVVPATSNVSNLQSIPAKYSSLNEMYQFASHNNVSNEWRWEEKIRLCNPFDIYRVESWFEIIEKTVKMPDNFSFPDDKISYAMRSNGYKMILAKDAFCHHFGSVTIKDDMQSALQSHTKYIKGRIEFIKECGIDPWGYGMGPEMRLIEFLDFSKKSPVHILGINSGLGANLVKIKSQIRECTRQKEIKIDALSQYAMNLKDLKGISNNVHKLQEWTEFESVLNEKYDYILLENGAEERHIEKIEKLTHFLKTGGYLAVRGEDKKLCQRLEEQRIWKCIIRRENEFWLLLKCN